jgi:hypothetical protein
LSSEFEAAIGSFIQKLVICRAGQIQNTLEEQWRELRARKVHEQDSDGIAQAVRNPACAIEVWRAAALGQSKGGVRHTDWTEACE